MPWPAEHGDKNLAQTERHTVNYAPNFVTVEKQAIALRTGS